MTNIKNFYEQMNVGKAKYTVIFFDGESLHNDGSPFYRLATFKNKKKKDAYVKNLIKSGYVYK